MMTMLAVSSRASSSETQKRISPSGSMLLGRERLRMPAERGGAHIYLTPNRSVQVSADFYEFLSLVAKGRNVPVEAVYSEELHAEFLRLRKAAENIPSAADLASIAIDPPLEWLQEPEWPG